MKQRKIANWVFWLSAIIIFSIVFFGGEKVEIVTALLQALASVLFASGLLWIVITPQKSPYDVDPKWHQNRPKRWFEKYLNNPVGRFLFTNKIGNFILICSPFGLFFGLIFLSVEPEPGDPNRFWLWIWCTIFWPILFLFLGALEKKKS